MYLLLGASSDCSYEIVTMLQTDRQTDTGEFRFLDPRLSV